MKKIYSIVIFWIIGIIAYCQNDFVQIETNKIVSIFSFLETASGQRSISTSFKKLIGEQAKDNKNFQQIIEEYATLNLEYSILNRYSSVNTKDLIWVAASNSRGIDDFSTRIIGILPSNIHSKLIRLMYKTEPYYEDLIWNDEQQNIKRMESQLSKYKNEIEQLYIKISKFYGITWNSEIPFKVSLYPIPLKQGNTIATPKENVLICSFLSHNENDYKSRLGVIIHEMCHILYGKQPKGLQYQIDKWFSNDTSDYSSLAYSYFDEGLATVLGNGWAYKQMHGTIDTSEWYNNKHIDGFAHALFPLTDEYMSIGGSLDSSYVKKAITLFGETFPKAMYNTKILMNEIMLYSNTKDEEIALVSNELNKNFNIRSSWFSTPIIAEQSIQSFKKEKITKLFIVDNNHNNTISLINKQFSNLNVKSEKNTIQTFFDSESNSNILIIILDGLGFLEKGLNILSGIEYLERDIYINIK